MHIERKVHRPIRNENGERKTEQGKQDDLDLFKSFYEEMKGEAADEETTALFTEILHDVKHK